MKQLFWFTGALSVTLFLCLFGWFLITLQAENSSYDMAQPIDSLLLNIQFPMTDITDAKTGEAVALEDSLSDAVVVVLGGIGCSRDQVEVLKWWKQYKMADTLRQSSIMTLYADPLMGAERSRHESLLLHRASQAEFPALVYEGEEFNLRSMGIQTPQTLRVKDGNIVEVLPSQFSMVELQVHGRLR